MAIANHMLTHFAKHNIERSPTVLLQGVWSLIRSKLRLGMVLGDKDSKHHGQLRNIVCLDELWIMLDEKPRFLDFRLLDVLQMTDCGVFQSNLRQ